MGNLVDKILNGYDAAVRGLNEAAFGDVRNVFNGSKLNKLMGRPIGLIANSYDFMAMHLRRNIGNSTHIYDGYGTPVGEISNPFYNSFEEVPWFFMDAYKNSTPNYIEYIKAVYGASTSVENINTDYSFRLTGGDDKVGIVQTSELRDTLGGDFPENISIINPNGSYTDSLLGMMSSQIVSRTLYRSVNNSDLRYSGFAGRYGITDSLKYYFGLNTDALGHSLNISSHNAGESFLSNDYYISDAKSPVYNSNYGNIDNIGIYDDYINNLSKDSLYHFRYNTQVYLTGNTTGRITEEDASLHDGGKSLQGIRKYLPTKNDNYLSIVGVTTGIDEYVDNNQIRYIFKNSEGSVFDSLQGGLFVYTEKDENGSSTDIYGNSFNSGTRFSTYSSFTGGLSHDNLLKKTNEAFKQGKYNTIIAKFKTGKLDENDETQTAVSSKHGMSHGRNLLKTEKDYSQGYENPYCRVWTFHHQYHRLADAIRPFQEKGENGNVVISQKELYEKYGFNAFSADHSGKDGFEDGRTRLGKYGVINQHNGLVNITPIDSGDPNKKVSIKNCMFSIENLAWKDMFSKLPGDKDTFQNGGLSSEQKGPFGGRIMWFPPYALKFNETVNVDWSQNNFIGRGESIYTYKNTRRSGQLSFKLLIDHPSIINYWENRGRSTSNSVDDIDDPEQQLLRFFAGCEMLSGKKAETKKVDVAVEDIPQPYPNSEIHTFFVFFPNDYSGVDDDPDYTTEYLTNGIGTWRIKTPISICGTTTFTDANNNYRPSYSKLSILLDEEGTKVDNSYGGYEMRAGKSISYVTKRTKNDRICIAKYGEQIGETVFAQEGPSDEHDYDRKWYYRVDNKRIDGDKLKQEKNYIDKGSQCINSHAGLSTVKNNLSIDNSDNLYSFADVFVALTESSKKSRDVLSGLYDEEAVSDIKNLFRDRSKIKGIICTGQASKQGNSSPESKNVQRNDELAKQRANTICKWLRKYLKGISIQPTTIEPEGETKEDDINNIVNKLHRCVKVEIYVSTESSETIQETERHAIRPGMTGSESGTEKSVGSPDYPSGTLYGARTFIDNAANIYYDDKTRENKETYMKLSNFGKSIDYLTFNLKNSYDDGTLNINGVFNAVDNFRKINMASTDLALNFPGDDRVNLDLDGGEDSSRESNTTKGEVGNGLSIPSTNNIDGGYETRTGSQEEVPLKRYDNESKFFEMLEIEEPFLHQKISDKIKYFDPAFHSVSPEGFNARLTFLQQCTRQGPTCGSSDIYTGANTANNLAFGRPPVCVLRIGDFYYTKIIIESITIDFGDVMWDLNAEGIGVMPMIADINISFNYIGGSSLSGPISRLQNALSFNMYANTEVYDNRSELPEYDDDGDLINFGHNPLN